MKRIYVVLLLSYIGIHYFFVSQSAHLPALIPVFLEVGVGGGVPGSLMAFSILFANCIALSSVGIHPCSNKHAKPYAQHLRRKHQGYGGVDVNWDGLFFTAFKRITIAALELYFYRCTD